MADVALDDYIKTHHITRSGRGRGAGGAGAARGGRGGRGGQSRGGSQRQVAGTSRNARPAGRITKNTTRRGGRPARVPRTNSFQNNWQHDLFGFPAGSAAGGGARTRGLASGTKLLVSNLEFSVSDSDIRDLFSEFGALKKASVHYDRSGRSIGTAEVIFMRTGDALAALRKYNGVPLDGQPMDIQLVTSGIAAINGAVQRRVGGRGRGGAKVTSAPVGRAKQANRGATRSVRGRRGTGRGGGQKRAEKPNVTQEQLDMELDDYQSATNKIA